MFILSRQAFIDIYFYCYSKGLNQLATNLRTVVQLLIMNTLV